jgi:hypothetical protein
MRLTIARSSALDRLCARLLGPNELGRVLLYSEARIIACYKLPICLPIAFLCLNIR